MAEDMEKTGRKRGVRRALRVSVITVAAVATLGTAGMVAARGMAPGGMFGGWGITRMLDRVDATAEQGSEINAIIAATRGDILPLVEAMPERRAAVMELLGAETLDRDAFEDLRQEMLVTADEVSAKALAGFLDAAEVLTQEQRATLIAEAGQRSRMGMRGHGPREGWGRSGHRGDHDGWHRGSREGRSWGDWLGNSGPEGAQE